MSIGFIFAGQGSQRVGMGKEIYDAYPAFKETIDNADKFVRPVTDICIKELCFEGPEEKLSSTRNTQPAMVAFAVGVTKILKSSGIIPEYVCGLSLGEYSALYAADVLDEKTVLELVSKRGKYMEAAAKGINVKMSAVLMAERQLVIDTCERVTAEFSDGKLVAAANFNCPGQIVISGNAEAVDKASAYLKEAGVKRIMPLNVSGPFHTPIMKPAGDALAAEFKDADFNAMTSKVIFNCTGKELQKDETIPGLLEKQVQSSVYMEDSIRYMAEHGVDTIIEIGPGKAISKFVKKTAPQVRVLSIDTAADLENVIKELKA